MSPPSNNKYTTPKKTIIMSPPPNNKYTTPKKTTITVFHQGNTTTLSTITTYTKHNIPTTKTCEVAKFQTTAESPKAKEWKLMEALTPHLNSIMPIYRFNRSEGMLKLDFCANRMFILPTPRRVLKDTTCSICLQEFKGGDMVRVLVGCEHEFHYCCIDVVVGSLFLSLV